jgi:hypothetical protein
MARKAIPAISWQIAKNGMPFREKLARHCFETKQTIAVLISPQCKLVQTKEKTTAGEPQR